MEKQRAKVSTWDILEMHGPEGLILRASWTAVAEMLAIRARPCTTMLESTKYARKVCRRVANSGQRETISGFTIKLQEPPKC